MNILVIGDANSIFIYEYISEILLKSKYKISILNTTGRNTPIADNYLQFYQKNQIKIMKSGIKNSKKFHRLNVLVSRFQSMLQLFCCRKYDIVDVLFIYKDLFPLAFFIKKKGRLILTVFGSDLLRASKMDLKIKKLLFKRANCITVETKFFISEFKRIYGDVYTNKIKVTGMGIKYIELIENVLHNFSKEECKRCYNIPSDKLIIFVGYNGSKEHKHIEILDLLENFSSIESDKIFLVFHCAYSLNEDYKHLLEKRLHKSRFEGVLLTEFLRNEELIKLRMCADVMLNLQRTDAISSSMLESLAVGSIVVKGDWLVYSELEQAGTFLLSIEKLDLIGTAIFDIITHAEHYKELTIKNKDIIYKKYSWKSKARAWKSVVEDK